MSKVEQWGWKPNKRVCLCFQDPHTQYVCTLWTVNDVPGKDPLERPGRVVYRGLYQTIVNPPRGSFQGVFSWDIIDGPHCCPIHIITFTVISILATYHIQKRRGQALLFSFEYNLSPEFDIKVKVTMYMDI